MTVAELRKLLSHANQKVEVRVEAFQKIADSLAKFDYLSAEQLAKLSLFQGEREKALEAPKQPPPQEIPY